MLRSRGSRSFLTIFTHRLLLRTYPYPTTPTLNCTPQLHPPPSLPHRYYTCKMAANIPAGYLSKQDKTTIVTDYGRTFDVEKCPAGTYTDAVRSPAFGTTCFPCPAGKFGATIGLATNLCSGPCIAGHYCPAGETDQYGVKCPAGMLRRLRRDNERWGGGETCARLAVAIGVFFRSSEAFGHAAVAPEARARLSDALSAPTASPRPTWHSNPVHRISPESTQHSRSPCRPWTRAP